jgi:hypothetical protein
MVPTTSNRWIATFQLRVVALHLPPARVSGDSSVHRERVARQVRRC